ncbi:Molybdopterin molybdenumtransferase [Aquisphaera giovannonii]|uniref:Molybdopterin molybdenumtransferase n=1 Tax=Aquisphaera giovannonii TaxID=406548 RepID=A0A5B9WE81_9BACT|nr:gephyrin-like molybdotransferase Glp [Aquisphaera giovannonii]QEH38200.1 Molybdopterin molybdenumtransferase [Aquisphaera giovannonii]
MLSVEEALALVLETATPLPPATAGLAEAAGLVLAEDVPADADQPPFDKALMDGYAVRASDVVEAGRPLRLAGTIHAGEVAAGALGPGEAAAIMTGAPMPAGADAVVMVEHSEERDGAVRLRPPRAVAPGQNVLGRGRVYRLGDRLLAAGDLLTPPRIGLLAAVGHAKVRVVPRPTLAIVPTGDELVEPDQVPGPGRIRNSNAAMLAAVAIGRGLAPRVGPIAADEPAVLAQALAEGLESDVLLVTGGVSAGRKDLVPAALESRGVRQVFHKVAMKPGKPLWFGSGPGRGDRPGTLVFGLPGNPLSGLVGFLRFVGPALGRLAGRPEADETVPARLAADCTQHGDLTHFRPAALASPPGEAGEPAAIELLDSVGSADVLAAARADGFAVLPPGDRVFRRGEIVRFLPLR